MRHPQYISLWLIKNVRLKETDFLRGYACTFGAGRGVRMGHDPKTSLLNKWNQMHACPNVFVTDGACMTSVSTQNPSLTFMALTARAAHHAMEQLDRKKM